MHKLYIETLMLLSHPNVNNKIMKHHKKIYTVHLKNCKKYSYYFYKITLQISYENYILQYILIFGEKTFSFILLPLTETRLQPTEKHEEPLLPPTHTSEIHFSNYKHLEQSRDKKKKQCITPKNCSFTFEMKKNKTCN